MSSPPIVDEHTGQPQPGPPKRGRGARWLGSQIERIVANRILMQLMTAVTLLAVLIYGTATFSIESHLVLSLLAIATALIVTRFFPEYRLVSVVLSVAISLRYIIWRGLETLNVDSGIPSAVVSLLLYGAEIYTVFVLIGGYFQTTVYLDRRSAPIPLDVDKLPTVDVFIPTYNEPLEIVRRTLVSALAMDYQKKRVYLLDDGRRAEMKELAEEVGAGYITRPDNKHAKSGNINHAMEHTDGELIAFFDADHAPVRSFLQLTIGFFLENDNLSLAQTPHHFYNADPFERNLYTARRVPPEQNLFYHLVQVSNDFWNSAFFCGSCAVIRRVALEDVGGMAVETVTEDAHTALKMQARGWDTAYLNVPQAAGLATESFSAYVGQRIRWARGMAQILRIDTPFLKRGLAWYQRLNYTVAASHFFFGLPRMIFLLAPVTYLVFGLNPLDEDVFIVLLYAAPHLVLAYVNASAAHRNQRHTFWPEVYEAAMAPWSAAVTTLALFFPKQGSFNVTPKGSQSTRTTIDWRVSWVIAAMLLICLAGFPGFFFWAARFPEERPTLIVALVWNVYNVFLLLAALAAGIERPQRRRTFRIPVTFPVVVIEQTSITDEGPQLTDEIDDLDEDSYAPVEAVDPGDAYQEGLDDFLRRPETSEATLASENRPIPSLIPEQDELGEHVWRETGQTIDLSEHGARFLIPYHDSVPTYFQLTILADDGSRTTVLAEALDHFKSPNGAGTVVRARFRHMNARLVHQLIRLMFSDPNAWSGSKYAEDRPWTAFWLVMTAPTRAIMHWLGLVAVPSEYEPLPLNAREVHRPVLQCFHCQGVLLRPLPICPHCGEPLSSVDETHGDVHDGTFDHTEPREPRSSFLPSALTAALLVGVALILALGWDSLQARPAAANNREEALELAHVIAAEDGEQLAVEFEQAIRKSADVPADWGSRIVNRRFEYPRLADPRERVHDGEVPLQLGELYYELHSLESRYRRDDAPTGLALTVRDIRAGFQELQ